MYDDISGSAWGYVLPFDPGVLLEGEYMGEMGRGRVNVHACGPLPDQFFYARPYAGRV
jgi:hypothetical protein